MPYTPKVSFVCKASVEPEEIVNQLGAAKGWTILAPRHVEVSGADAQMVRFAIYGDLAHETWTCEDPAVSADPFFHREDGAAVTLYHPANPIKTWLLFGQQLSPHAHAEAVRAGVAADYMAFRQWLLTAPI